MGNLTCWEYMKCGKEPGGDKTHASGICPVAARAFESRNNGMINEGRLCWVLADACDFTVKCSERHHKSSCFSCAFRYKVVNEEGLTKVCESTGTLLRSEKAKQIVRNKVLSKRNLLTGSRKHSLRCDPNIIKQKREESTSL